VRKKLSIAIMVLGVVVGVFAVVWWQVVGPQMVKLPSDIDNSMDFEGTLTLYVDEDTGTPLGQGSETSMPVAATRRFAALPELFTSGTGFFEDTMTLSIGEKTAEPQVSHYALSRTTRKCVESDENWAFSEDNKVDRTGVYGPLFPPGLQVGETVSAYYDDPAKAFDVKIIDKIENWNQLGITVLKVDASRPSAPYDPEAAEVLLVRGRGLPTQISLDQIRSILRFNFDYTKALPVAQYVPGGVRVPSGVQVPAAVKAALAQLEQTITDHPLTVSFNQESSDFYYIEQTTGATVGATFDRTTTMSIDTSVAQEVTNLLSKYTPLPLVGPKISAALERVNEVAAAYRAPIKAFTQSISMTEASEATMAEAAKDKIALMTWVRSWIPLIAGALGALLLIVGLLVLLVPRRAAA
jgi:hypothetical protein